MIGRVQQQGLLWDQVAMVGNCYDLNYEKDRLHLAQAAVRVFLLLCVMQQRLKPLPAGAIPDQLPVCWVATPPPSSCTAFLVESGGVNSLSPLYEVG